MTRIECNREIVRVLSRLVEDHPDWRFHQLLINFNVEVPGDDRFHEESEWTLRSLLNAVKGVDRNVPSQA